VFLKLQPWRDSKGAIHEEAWKASVYLPDEAAWQEMDRTYPKVGTLVEVLVDQPGAHEGGEGELFEHFLIRPANDPALPAMAPPKALSIEDPVLGTLEWNSALGIYQGTSKAPPKFKFQMDDGGRSSPNLDRARKQIGSIERNADALRTQVATELIALYNRSWRNGPERDVAWLAGRLVLTSARLDPERDSVLLYYADGGAFRGHIVEVAVEGGRVTSATLGG
jgi:hypothetical protein